MGYFVPDEQPVIWRGPMLHKAIQQLVSEAWWDEPDFLLIDMPPGTGDVALTLSEVLPRIEMYVVTTPQAAAQRVAQAFGVRGTKTEAQRARRHREHELVHRRRREALRDLRRRGGARLAQELGNRALGTDSPRHQLRRRRRRGRADRPFTIPRAMCRWRSRRWRPRS